MEQLRKLLAVRELRLKRIRAQLARVLSAFEAVDSELACVDAELRQIAQQRQAWERDWQQWLRQNGVVRHGQDYNLAHTALSAWERDAAKAREEILVRHRRALEQVQAAKQLMLKAEQQLQALRDQVRDQERRGRARRAALFESRQQDDARPAVM